MSTKELKNADKSVSNIMSFSERLVDVAKRAAEHGDSLDSLEKEVADIVRQMEFATLELFIHLNPQKRPKTGSA